MSYYVSEVWLEVFGVHFWRFEEPSSEAMAKRILVVPGLARLAWGRCWLVKSVG